MTYGACSTGTFKSVWITGAELYLLHCRVVSSCKQYISPPIDAFDKLCVCHAATCRTSSSQNDSVTSVCPAWNQDHLSARGHRAHAARSGSASSPSRAPCLHASSCQTGQLSYTAFDTGPFRVSGIVMPLCILSETIALDIVNICMCSTR